MDENFFVEILVQKETQRRSKNVTRALCCQSEHKVKSVYNVAFRTEGWELMCMVLEKKEN